MRRAGAALGETLREIGLAPDVRWVSAAGAKSGPAKPQGDGTSASEDDGAAVPAVEFRYIHRQSATADIYFVFNHSDQPAAGEATFRVAGRRPEMWDAVGGTHVDAPVFRTGANRTTVPQIFIAGVHIGGCDDLVALERAGKLDALLAG